MGIADSVLKLAGRGLKHDLRALKAAAKYSGAQQLASDAYWSATNPVDRIMGRGRAANQRMEVPFGPGRGVRGLLNDFTPMDQSVAAAVGVSAAKRRAVAAAQRTGPTPDVELSGSVPTLIDKIAALGHKKVKVVDPGGGGPAWLSEGFEGRWPGLIGPNGKVYLAAKPGFHHDDVASAAGLPSQWPSMGYQQIELHGADPTLNVPGRLAVGGWTGVPMARKHAYGVARLRDAIKQAGGGIVTRH